MSEFSRLFQIARTDFSYFFRTKWLMAILLSLNISDMLVTGLVYSRMISFNYFRFLVPGIVIMGLFSAATDTGRRVWLGLREGVVQYYLTLPVRTFGLVVAYVISGGLGGLVYSSSLLIVASLVSPPGGLVNMLLLLPFLFILSTGMAGLAAFFASISKQGEIYWAYAQAIQTTFVTVSTIFFPIELFSLHMPWPVGVLAQANPLSLAVAAMRNSVFGTGALDLALVTNLVLASLPLAVAGVLAYWVILRRIRLYGKP